MSDLRAHPVVALLRERGADGRAPGARADPHVLALAIEGGGMRGVVSAGMVSAIQDLGLAPAFDVVVGVSAGAANAYAMLAGRGPATALGYVDFCTSGRFIDVRRAARRRGPVMDLDHLVDDLVLAPPDDGLARVLGSGVRLAFVATDVDAARATVLEGFADREDVRAALLASSMVPGVAGEPVARGARRFLDGAITESIPYAAALGLGATHVLVLQTRPYGIPLRAPSPPERLLVERALRRVNPALVAVYRSRPERYLHAVDELAARTADHTGPPYLATIRARAGTPPVGHLEQDRARLRAGAISGVRAVHLALTGVEPWVDGALRVHV